MPIQKLLLSDRNLSWISNGLEKALVTCKEFSSKTLLSNEGESMDGNTDVENWS